MFHKILCGFDFSEPSLNALLGALRIAHRDGARLLLVNVLDDSRLEEKEAADEVELRTQRMREAVSDKVRESFPATGKEFLQQIEVEVLNGRPAAELLRAIGRENPDLVVVATHGRTGIFHLMLGSVAEKVLRHSTSPVLLVRQPAEWPPKKVLLPIDFSAASEEEAMLASQLKFENVELMHVLGMPDLVALSVGPAAESLPNESVLREAAMKELQSLRSKHPSIRDAKIHVSIGPAGEEICRRAEENGFDLILLPTEGKSGVSRLLIGSVAERVARHAPCNVLTFATNRALPLRREVLAGL